MHLHLANSKAILTTSENIEIIDWKTAKILHILNSGTSIGNTIVSEDGEYLYAISRNNIKIWELKN